MDERLSQLIRALLRTSFIFFLLCPVLIWVFVIKQWDTPGLEWVYPLGVSFFQSVLSAAGSVILGFLMVIGALSIRSKGFERVLEFWLLIPNLIPQLFLILAILNLSEGIFFLRGGLTAVVCTHVLLNSGLVALALLRLLDTKLSGYLDLALIEGASRRMIWLEVVVPALRNEILFLALFVFSVCLTSFSIPLVLGGGTLANFEILIYETLRADADWSRAIYYALIQIATLFVLAIWIPKPVWNLSVSSPRWRSIGVKSLLPLAYLPTALLLFGWAIGIVRSVKTYVPEDLGADPGTAALNTILVSLGTGLFTLALCLWITYLWPSKRLSVFMKSYLSPSSAVTGFAFLLLPGQDGEWPLIKIMVALTLISFPLLFRWIGQAALESMEEQIAVARTMGASWSQIVFEIVWPQRANVFFRMAGLSSLWASGDFALCPSLPKATKHGRFG